MMNIRKATHHDVRSFAELNKIVHQLHVDQAPARYRVSTQKELTEFFDQWLKTDGVEIWIGSEDDVDVGYVVGIVNVRPETAFSYSSKIMLVDQLSVHSDHRKKGHGKALMEWIRKSALDQKCDRIALDVAHFNKDAFAFYEALGYEPMQHRLFLSP